MRTPLLLLLALVLTCSSYAQCPNGLSGNYTVGPTGTFPSITRAMDTLKKKGVTGPVFFELQSNYTSAAETFPLRLTEYGCADSTRAVTIRPAANASNLQISSNHDTVTLDINTGSYFIIDGRSGGTSTTKNLRIANTNLNGMAVRLINDASYNGLRYLDLRGVTRYFGRGVVTIDGTIRTKGNDRNRIDTCTIADGATTPSCLVMFWSNTIGNNNNLLNSCDLFNFYDRDNQSTAVAVYTGNDSNAIVNNSIYQTAPRSYLGPIGSNIYGIRATGFVGALVIANNFIGGTAPQAGGSKMELYGFTSFRPLSISSRAGTPFRSIVQGNVIRNIRGVSDGFMRLVSLGDEPNPGFNSFNGFFQNNTIGSQDSDSSIYYKSSSSSGGFFYGVMMAPSNTDSVVFNNNKIGGIYVEEYPAGLNHVEMYLLWVYRAVSDPSLWRVTIKGNEFGSPIRPRSVWNRSGGPLYSLLVQTLNCYCSTPIVPNTIRVEDNLLSNIVISAPAGRASSAFFEGIYVQGQAGANVSIAGNKVNRIFMDKCSPSYLSGIHCDFVSSGNSTFDIKGNTVHTLYSVDEDYGSGNPVTGIRLDYSTTPGNTVNISRNFIHSLMADGLTSKNKTIGIDNEPGYPGSMDNNMIRLGIDSAGQSITSSGEVYGIVEGAGNVVQLHNTIYIGGEGVTTFDGFGYSNGSSAFYRRTPYDANTSYIIRNNIYVNLRKNAGVNASNYAVRLTTNAFTSVTPVKFNYNFYQAAMSNAVISGGFDTFSLALWKPASGQDAQSLEGVPNFVNATGTSSTVDLHLKFPSPADGVGTPAFTTLLDFDSDSRASLTPVDIGADAGNYSVTTAVGQLQLQGYALNAFPNPTTHTLFIRVTSPLVVKASLNIYNLAGQKLAVRELTLLRGDNSLRLQELDGLAAGTYIIELQTPKGKLPVIIIKQ